MMKMLSIKQVTWCVTASLLFATATLFSMELPSRNLSQTLVTVTLADGTRQITPEERDLLIKHSSVIKSLVENNNNPASINLAHYNITEKSFGFIISALSSNHKNIDIKFEQFRKFHAADPAAYKVLLADLEALKLPSLLKESPEEKRFSTFKKSIEQARRLAKMETMKKIDEEITLTIPAKHSPEYSAIQDLFNSSKTLKNMLADLNQELTPGTVFSIPTITSHQLYHIIALAKDGAFKKGNTNDVIQKNITTIEHYLKKASLEARCDILLAADYLEIESLLDSTADFIANDLLINSFNIQFIETTLPEILLDFIQSKFIKLVADFEFKEYANLADHTDLIHSIAFSPNGTMLASASDDKTIKLWNIQTGELIATLTGHTGTVLAVAFNSDGNLLASGSGDETIKIWDVKTGEIIATLKGHTAAVSSLTFHPNGEILASGSWDQTTKLWDVKTKKELSTLTGHTDWVISVAFSPDGTILASGSGDKTIKLWDVKTRKSIATLTGHTDTVFAVAFSPDGTILASGSGDKTIKLWDVKTRKSIATLTGHTDWVNSIAFSPDGTILASSGSYDETIKLWNIKTGEIIATLTGHTSTVFAVAFSPDGTILASGLGDNTIKLWASEELLLKPLTLKKTVIFYLARELGIDSLSEENRDIFNSLPDFAKALIEKKKETGKEEKK